MYAFTHHSPGTGQRDRRRPTIQPGPERFSDSRPEQARQQGDFDPSANGDFLMTNAVGSGEPVTYTSNFGVRIVVEHSDSEQVADGAAYYGRGVGGRAGTTDERTDSSLSSLHTGDLDPSAVAGGRYEKQYPSDSARNMQHRLPEQPVARRRNRPQSKSLQQLPQNKATNNPAGGGFGGARRNRWTGWQRSQRVPTPREANEELVLQVQTLQKQVQQLQQSQLTPRGEAGRDHVAAVDAKQIMDNTMAKRSSGRPAGERGQPIGASDTYPEHYGNLLTAPLMHYSQNTDDQVFFTGTMERKFQQIRDKRVSINIGGRKFTTTMRTLMKQPRTRLAEAAMTLGDENTELYYDRNAEIFQYILDYYRTGVLHLPSATICPQKIREEMKFWDIDEQNVSECCMEEFLSADEKRSQNDKLEKEFCWKMDVPMSLSDSKTWNNKVFRFLDNHSSSIPATVYGLIVLACVFLSLVTLVLRTDDQFLVPVVSNETERQALIDQAADHDSRILTNTKAQRALTMRLNFPLALIDDICICVFTFDLVVRFLFCPRRIKFLQSLITIVDIITTLPMTALFIMRHADPDLLERSLPATLAVTYLEFLKLLRFVRVFKFTDHYSGLRVLVIALSASVRELILLTNFLMLGMVFFATVIYYCEFWEQDSSFTNILIGFWWSIVTMSTVGYGDYAPKSVAGYIGGSFCALAGIIFIALPIPIIVNNFGLYYTYAVEQRNKRDMMKQRIKGSMGRMGLKVLGKLKKGNKENNEEKPDKRPRKNEYESGTQNGPMYDI